MSGFPTPGNPVADVMAREGAPIAESLALASASLAATALRDAVRAYEAAGFGSRVTDPLRDAVAQVERSIKEAKQ